jgi:hypothetical protein
MTETEIELKKIYYESGIWRRYNFYDFVEELIKILIRNKCPKKKQNSPIQ